MSLFCVDIRSATANTRSFKHTNVTARKHIFGGAAERFVGERSWRAREWYPNGHFQEGTRQIPILLPHTITVCIHPQRPPSYRSISSYHFLKQPPSQRQWLVCYYCYYYCHKHAAQLECTGQIHPGPENVSGVSSMTSPKRGAHKCAGHCLTPGDEKSAIWYTDSSLHCPHMPTCLPALYCI